MANFFYIDNLNKSGKLAINVNAFDLLVLDAIKKVNGISFSSKQLKKNQFFRLNRPAFSRIVNGIVHVYVYVDVKKDLIAYEVSRQIKDEVVNTLLASVETIPFDVEVKVESLI